MKFQYDIDKSGSALYSFSKKRDYIIRKRDLSVKREWPRRFRHVRRDSIAIGPHPRRADALAPPFGSPAQRDGTSPSSPDSPKKTSGRSYWIWKDSALPQGPKRRGPAAQSRRPCSARWPPRSGPRFPNPGCPTIWASSSRTPRLRNANSWCGIWTRN